MSDASGVFISIKWNDAPPSDSDNLFETDWNLGAGAQNAGAGFEGVSAGWGNMSSPSGQFAEPMTGSHIPGVDTGARNGQTTFIDGSGQAQTISSGDGSFGSGSTSSYETAMYRRLAEQLPGNADGNPSLPSWQNVPSPWSDAAMNNSRLGTGLAPAADAMLAESPTAQAELQNFYAARGIFQWSNSGDSSKTEFRNSGPVISISQDTQTPEQIASQVAHELGHFSDSNPVTNSPPEACYDTHLNSEGAATINNIVIADEINTLNSGMGNLNVPVSSFDPTDNVPQYRQIYGVAVQSGDWSNVDHQIGQIYGKSEMVGSKPPEPYQEYYRTKCGLK